MKTTVAEPTPPALRCRVRIELESPDGDELLQLDLAKEFEPVSGHPVPGILSREVGDFLRGEVVAELHDRIFEMDAPCDPEERDFESEFACRCDATDRIVSSLRWLNPPGPSDPEARWMQGMTEVFMARQQNDLMMRRELSAREPG